MTRYLVLGDSHVGVFASPVMREHFAPATFEVVGVGGATVSGLENPNSRTRARAIFEYALARFDGDAVIVMLGEVDAGFVIWYRAEKYDADVAVMLAEALARYQQMLIDIARRFSCIVVSAPLPTIRDGDQLNIPVANARRDVKATQAERTMLTRSFNRSMQAFCAEQRIAYVMLDEHSVGKDGLLRESLYSRVPGDHHYDVSELASLLCRSLPGAMACHAAVVS